MGNACTNCYKSKVDEEKQNFNYRDWEGNHWMACVKPICDDCISTLFKADGDWLPHLPNGYDEPEEPFYG